MGIGDRFRCFGPGQGASGGARPLVLVFERTGEEEKGIQGGCSKPKPKPKVVYVWKRSCEVRASSRQYLLNLDCNHYVRIHSWGNSSATSNSLRDSTGILSFFDINLKGLDGIQGPIYVGTGCVFRRHALYGYDAPKSKKPPTRPCNCLPKWCCCECRCSGKRKTKTANKPKVSPPKRISKKGDSDALASEVFKEGVEGAL